MNQERLLDAYCNQYTKTLELSKIAEKRRNKNFVILCTLEAISLLFVSSPDLVYDVVNAAISKEIEKTVVFSSFVLQTFLWLLITYVFIRYIQDTLYVDRQYNYISELENKISLLLDESSLFKRESDQYLNCYPIVLNLITLFYKLFCPILFTIINLIHICHEWKNETPRISLLIDSSIFIVISILMWFFFFQIHSKLSEWIKKHLPIFNWISEKIHKILKDV